MFPCRLYFVTIPYEVLILTTLTRGIRCVSFLRMHRSVILCKMYPYTELWKLHLLFLENRNSACYARYENPLRKTPFRCGQKYVETYSSSNAAAHETEKMVHVINIQYIQYKKNFLIQ